MTTLSIWTLNSTYGLTNVRELINPKESEISGSTRKLGRQKGGGGARHW